MARVAMTGTSVALSAATPTRVLAANNQRQYLALQNAGGTNPLTVAFSKTIVAGAGVNLDPASAADGQGGSVVWDGNVGSVPSGEIWAISTSGSTISIVEG